MVAEIKLPEAVPHLIAVLEGDEHNLYELTAQALKNFHAPQAGPILRKRLSERHLGRQLVRIDARTYREDKITEFAREDIRAVAEIIGHGKLVISHGEWDKPEDQTYSLLTPSTGALETVKGEFRPLIQQTYRPLQPVNNSQELWAAIPDKKLNKTVVGRYDAKQFAFTPLIELPDIQFDSMQMWVDESTRLIYVAYGGQLIRFKG